MQVHEILSPFSQGQTRTAITHGKKRRLPDKYVESEKSSLESERLQPPRKFNPINAARSPILRISLRECFSL
jgi:hypothetical protein